MRSRRGARAKRGPTRRTRCMGWGSSSGAAEAEQGRGLLLLERENYPRAQLLLEAALRTQGSSGNERGAALTRLLLGEGALGRGDTVGARRQLARAVSDLNRMGDPVAEA